MPRRLPQALDIVEGSFFGKEDVDNEVNVVEQDPFAKTLAFYGVGIGAEIALQTYFDLVRNGLCLPLVGAAGDEEEVGEASIYGIELEDAGVFRLFLITRRRRCCHHLTRGLGDRALFCGRGYRCRFLLCRTGFRCRLRTLSGWSFLRAGYFRTASMLCGGF